MHTLKKVFKLIKKDFHDLIKWTHRHKKLMHNVGLFLLSAAIIVTGAFMIWLASIKLPDFQSFEERKIENSTKIYDRTGEVLLYNVHQDIKRTVIPFGEMGQTIKDATVAVEDWKFYEHNGIRPTSIVRAIISNVFNLGTTQGGSTITQQVIKNTLLTQERTLTRKLKEWVLAIKLERITTKDDILSIYLNDAPYGGNLYGIKEASRAFFGKEPAEITVAEAAYLAAIPQSPTYYSPYGKHREALDQRKNLVLFKMQELGYINQETYLQAKTEVVEFQPRAASGIKAPHFVFFVIDYLNQKYGEDVVDSGGLTVITTLDYELQEKTEEIVARYAKENEEKYNASNAGAVIIDPNNGQILTMVGSRDYFDTEIDGNFNITLAKRQPGSSFKPFIYATAFKEGYTPETALFDVPTEFSTGCNPYGIAYPGYRQSDCYMPRNYDGGFRGPMNLRNALAQSINVPAVKLLYLVGLDDAIATARAMGITTLGDKNLYGLTLVIGGGEVTPLEMTSAYGTFATGGVHHSYARVLSVTDTEGSVLEEFVDQSQEVLPKNVALQISSILSDNTARTPIFGARSALHFPDRQVAVKTGTTNNNRDAWIMGYTPSVTVGAWAGNNDNTAMTSAASNVVALMWHEIINEALTGKPNELFETPENTIDFATPPVLRGLWQGGESFLVDRISGGLATEQTPRETIEERVITSVHTILYWIDKNNPRGGRPANPENDPQFNNWEIPIQNWWAVNQGNYPTVTPSDRPTGYDTVHGSQNGSIVTIVSPLGETEYPRAQPLTVSIETRTVFPVTQVDFFVNDGYIGTATTTPFSFTFTPGDLPSIQQDNTLRVIATDSAYNRTEATKIFSVSE